MKSTTILSAMSLVAAAYAHPAKSTKATPAASLPYTCQTFNVTIPIANVPTIEAPFASPQNELQAVAILNALTDRTQAPSGPPKIVNLTTTYNISAEYCQPNTTSSGPITLQVLTHGIGFNRSYWSFEPSKNTSDLQYNYVAAATAAGYHTFSYNRVGIKGSTMPDPLAQVQAPVELAVLTALSTLARAGKLPHQPAAPAKVVHVGHSYGSILSLALVSTAPTLSDGLILTGFTSVNTYMSEFLISTNAIIANLDGTKRFPNSSYPNGYWTWPSAAANQFSFFAYPNFDPAVLAQAEATKQPFALGELLSEAAVPATASKFTAPVFIIDGEKDLIFCGGNCTGIVAQGTDTVKAFNGSSSVETALVPGFGHGMNLHLNATGKVYTPIMNWLKSKGL